MGWCEGGKCFQVVTRFGDLAGRVSVTESKRTQRTVQLNVIVEGLDLSAPRIADVCHEIGLVLGLGRDLSEFYSICAEHPTLHVLPLIGAGRGLRSASMTENIIKALCSTNVTWTQAVKMINRIGQLGPVFPNFVNLNAWPTPREILRAGESYLTEVCRVGYRAESILKFCQDVCDKRIDPDKLTQLAADPEVESDDILAQLRSIRGIGPSSAHYLLGFLGRHDRLSIDSATVAHVAQMHMNGKKPTIKQIEKIYARYGNWKNLVWWYEHWLGWGSAKSILREVGIDPELSIKNRKTKRARRAS